MRTYGGISLTHLKIDETEFFEQTNFPFTANFGADPNTGLIGLAINYDAPEFSAEQIDTYGGYYAAALEAIVEDPSALVSRTSLMSTAETNRQLGDRRHAIALLTYRDNAHAPYRGDAVVIRGEDAPHVAPDLGWAARVDGRLLVIETPGDHRSLLSATHAGSLADRLAISMRDGVAALVQFTDEKSAPR